MIKLSLALPSKGHLVFVLGCVWAVVGGGVAASHAQILNVELAAPLPPPVVALPIPAPPQPFQLLFSNPTTVLQLSGAGAIDLGLLPAFKAGAVGSGVSFQAAVMSNVAVQMAASGSTSVLSTDAGLSVSTSSTLVQIPPSFALPDPVQELVDRNGSVFPPLAE